MKYYLDTEFLEGTQTHLQEARKAAKLGWSIIVAAIIVSFWFLTSALLILAVGLYLLGVHSGWVFRAKQDPTIDLISIAIVAEDGREYYAISKDFNLKEAWNRWQPRTGEGDRNNWDPKHYWVRENVLRPIWEDLKKIDDGKEPILYAHSFTYYSLKMLLKRHGKSNAQIAEEVKEFVYNQSDFDKYNGTYKSEPTFYGYYADYDWVVFCWLFGSMIDLPKGFPMYCRDLKQELDQALTNRDMGLYSSPGLYRVRDLTLDEKIESIKKSVAYPKQTNEHNALADARWNKKLHEFIQSL